MKEDRCNRCNHTWYRRKPDVPKWCPECKSPYWNKERVRDIPRKQTAELRQTIGNALK